MAGTVYAGRFSSVQASWSAAVACIGRPRGWRLPVGNEAVGIGFKSRSSLLGNTKHVWLGQYMREAQFSSGLGVSCRWNRFQIEVTSFRKYKARVAVTVYVGGSVQFRPRGELPLE